MHFVCGTIFLWINFTLHPLSTTTQLYHCLLVAAAVACTAIATPYTAPLPVGGYSKVYHTHAPETTLLLNASSDFLETA